MYIISLTLIYQGNDLHVVRVAISNSTIIGVSTSLSYYFSELDIFSVRIGIDTKNMDQFALQALKIQF